MDDCKSSDMHCPDLLDIYNEEFNFEHFPKEKNRKTKEVTLKEKYENKESFPLKSEYSSKTLSSGCCTENNLPVFTKVKSMGKGKSGDTNPSIELFISSYSKEIGENTELEKYCNNTSKENELHDFLRTVNQRPMNSNCKNVAKEDGDDKFWDFLKTNMYSAAADECALGLLSDAEQAELKSLSLITSSFDYGSQTLSSVEKTCSSEFSSAISTSMTYANVLSNTNVTVDGLSKQNSNGYCPKVKITDIEVTEKNSDVASKGTLNEFEDFSKPKCQKHTDKKIFSPKENKLRHSLNQDNLMKSNYSFENIDTEDTFWDFLNPNLSADEDIKCDFGSLTDEEIQELQSLLPIKTSPVNAASYTKKDSSPILNTVSPVAKVSSPLISPDEDIFKDLDLLLAEINTTVGDMQKQTEQGQKSLDSSEQMFNSKIQNEKYKSSQKSNSAAPSAKLTDTNKSYDPKIINQNIPVAVFPPLPSSIPLRILHPKALNKNQLQGLQQNTEQFYDNAKHNFKQGLKQATSTPCTFVNHSCLGVEKTLLKSNNVKVTESNSNIAPYPFCKFKPIACKTDSQFSLINFENTGSKYETENSTAVQLPVISSVFSIPANIYERSDFLHNQQILNESNELNASTNCFVEGPSQNLNVSHENINISTDVSETNADDSAAKRSSIYISPRKRKNTKRLLPRSSPKNSLFRVTDSSSNIQYDYENLALNNALDMKRRKTNESVKSDYSTDSGISVSGTPMCLPQIPQKLFALTSTNNAITPNSTPVYWIVSQNPQPNQNKNSDVLMVLNNGNQVINNPCIKMPIPLTNSNVPISTETTIPGVTSTQIPIPKANDKTTTTVFQQIPLHTVTVMNVEPSNGFAETSNSMKSDTLNNSKIQSVSHNALKTQVQIKSEANKIKFISTTMPQNLIQINNANIYTIPSSVSNISGSGGLQSTTSNASNNLYIQNANPQVNQPSLPVISNYYSLNTVHSNPSNQLMPGGLFPIQHVNQIPQPKIRPIKNIPLGKNKNAIQQIRIPVKIADIKDSVAANIYDTSKVSANILNSQRLKVSSTIPSMINQVKLTRNIVTSEAQAQNRVYDFIPYKPKSDSTNIVKRNIITSETEFINKDKFFRVQTLNSKNLSDKSSKVGESSNLISFYQGKETVWSNSSDTSVSSTHNVDSIQNTLSFDKVATKSSEFVSKPQSDGSQKNTLATIQQLFPPPVSTIPVCVMQTVQTTNKPAVTKVVVLQNTNTNNSVTQTSNQKNRRKVTTEKEKKVGRKTVRELLQERYNQSSSNKPFQPQLTTKILKPIYRLGSNGLLLPPDLPSLANKFSGASNSHYITAIKNNPSNPNKRPNIMILPSAAKTAQNTIISKEDCKKNYQEEPQTADNSQTVETNGNEIFKMPSDFLFEKMDTSKEYRPKYYDMCELRIGYFKVEDDVDSYGRFRSKFKVLFKKSLFVYDFPITKCNQIDLSNDYSNEEIVCIQVPFKTVLSMNMNNRHILIQVNKIPQVFLKNTEEGSDFISGLKEKHKITEGILDSLQNLSVHKITLRKRQADNLKVNLCQFDDRFLLLCSVGSNNSNSVLDASPFDEEIATLHLKKIFQKNRRNVIRRLPQWDPDRTLEPLEVLNSDHLVSSNHVCSCRISCRSLRCSCVKAAKICGTSGSVCQCTNCDNPLNLLQSFGINLEYSLNDCCLFQNIYQIPKLRNFLQRNVKLSCCNTVARVLDCIPGTVLCPNTECNEQLEFSWCGAVICYPERNPRNHCSFCGQCCFSNGCHCTICNRCYIVTSKYKDCPHCTGLIMNPVCGNYEFIDDEFASENIFESSTAKIFPKPEIIVLDGPSSANCNMEATFPLSKEGGDNERKESQEHLYLNKENVYNKSDEKCIFPIYMETDINTSAISEQKVEICNEFDSYETGNKNYMNKIAEAITNEVKSKECNGIFEDDLKIEIPPETSVKVMTKIDITSS